MNRLFDSEFYLQLVNSLNTLPAVEFEENDHRFEVANPTFSIVPDAVIATETKKKLYASQEFKKFLKEYIEKKFSLKKENISDEYSERIYRRMYDKGLRDNSYANLFTRVMYNPDVTKSDYKLLKDRRRDFPKYVIYNELGCFVLILAVYYKTPIGALIKKNMLLGGTMIGLAPLVVMFGTQKLNSVLLNRKVRELNLHTKYNVKYE